MVEQVLTTNGNSSKIQLSPGLTGEATTAVTTENTALTLGSGTVAVFATPALAALMEAAALDTLRNALEPGQTSVGVHLDVQHLAATPVGMIVRAEARLMTVEGRRLTFRVAAFDGVEQIGVGTHQRVIVDTERFMSRTAAKVR